MKTDKHVGKLTIIKYYSQAFFNLMNCFDCKIIFENITCYTFNLLYFLLTNNSLALNYFLLNSYLFLLKKNFEKYIDIDIL